MTNALNNDPSRTLFISNMPGMVNQTTWSNNNTATSAGIVMGTTDLTQCKSLLTTFTTIDPSNITLGVRSFNIFYNIIASNNYTVQANLSVVTDGTVNVDELGNYYYTLGGILSGKRATFFPNNTVQSKNNATALVPLCSGPVAGSGGAIGPLVYCNNNRIYPQFPYVDRVGIAYQTDSLVLRGGATSSTPTAGLDTVGLNVYRMTILEEASASAGESFTDNPTWTMTMTQTSSGSSMYQAVQWGYIMYCSPFALEYPCAVSVMGTAIIAVGSQFTSQCGSGGYGPLCSQPAYVLLGFTGTRTFFNKYGTTNYSQVSLAPSGEDYSDNYIYLSAPYVDSDGVTLMLNSTSGTNMQTLTEVLGGSQTNVINVFVNNGSRNGLGVPTEGIAVVVGVPGATSAQPSALVYDQTKTIFCSNLAGFQSNTFSASTAQALPTGTTNLASCTVPQLPPAQTKPTVVQGTPSNWTLAVSISDGATFTVQTILTVTSDGNLYTDSIGNRFILPIAASGSRTYYSLAGGVASVTGMSAIRGLLPIGNVTTSSNNLGGNNLNSNRIYPFAAPYLDALGVSFSVSPAAFYTGNTSASSTTNTITLYSYKDGTLEEVQVNGKYPVQGLQYASMLMGTTAPALPLPVTATGSQTVQWGYAWSCLPNTLDYPCLTQLSGVAVVSQSLNGTGASAYYTMQSFTGTRTYWNRYLQSYSTTVTLAPLGELTASIAWWWELLLRALRHSDWAR